MRKAMVLLMALALCLGSSAAEEAGTSGQLIPVSGARAVRAENESAKTYLFYADGEPNPVTAYVIPDDTARLRLEIAVSDNPDRMAFGDGPESAAAVLNLLDPDRGAFVCEQPMPDSSGGVHFTAGMLFDRETGDRDPDIIEYFLVRDEKYLEEIAGELQKRGCRDIRWEFADAAQQADPVHAYILHVVDQDNNPVPETYVNFCTDTACTMKKSDENGTVAFDGSPDIYHIQLLKVPEGYSFSADADLYTGRAYGEWLLRVRKD